MRKIKLSVIVLFAFGVTAASDPAKFYHSTPHRTPDVAIKSEPNFRLSTGDARHDLTSMLTAGYELIGYSAFNGRESGQKAIAKQAKRVGATDVVYLEKYTDTQSAGAIGSTSFSRWGAFSFVTPMSVRRYDQLAMYFRKAPRVGLGVYPRPLSDDEKLQIGSNKGVVITAVINGSPAFVAEVLPGDILEDLGGHAVWDSESMQAAIDAVKGRTTAITVFRAGQKLTKSLMIPTGDW